MIILSYLEGEIQRRESEETIGATKLKLLTVGIQMKAFTTNSRPASAWTASKPFLTFTIQENRYSEDKISQGCP